MNFLADKTYIISRPDEESRGEHLINRLAELQLGGAEVKEMEARKKVRYLPGKSFDKNEATMNLVTIDILNEAKELGLDTIMILHHDVLIVANALPLLHSVSKELDKTLYDLFHLGHEIDVTARKAISGQGITKTFGSKGAYAYIINSRIFDDMIHWLSKMDMPVEDVLRTKFHPHGRSYGATRNIASQKPDYKLN